MTHQDIFPDVPADNARLQVLFGSREATLRGAFLAGATVEDMARAMRRLKQLAFEEEETNFPALKLFLEMTVGTAGKGTRMLPPLKLPKTATLDQCGEAVDVILEALSGGLLSQEEAEAYISVIDKRASILRAKASAGEKDHDVRPINVTIQRRAEAATETEGESS